MRGLMQDWPLTVDKILQHASAWHPGRQVVTRSLEGPIVRTTYAEIFGRAKRVSTALQAEGIAMGDRVATLAFNTARHLEAWYGIMGIGAVCHTLNPRLFPEQIIYIVNHAGDRVILADVATTPPVATDFAALPRGGEGGVSDRRGSPARRRPKGSPTRAGSGRRPKTALGAVLTKPAPPAFATPRAPRAIQKAFFTPIDPTTCTRSWRCKPMFRACPRRHGAGGGSNVPRQRLGVDLHSAGGGCEASAPRSSDGRRLPARADSIRGSHGLSGGADSLADVASTFGRHRSQTADLEEGADRRLRLPRSHYSRLQRPLRY